MAAGGGCLSCLAVRGLPGERIGGVERAALAALFATNFALRVVYVFAFRFDSDETQHLHVSWGWAQGLVQYRDLFDNHTPLFHLLFAPLLALAPEGPGLLYAMRLAMLPIAAALLVLTFALGRRLFSLRVGLWAAALAGLFPRVFLRTVEFRPDNLWAVLWLAALVVAVSGRSTRRRGLAVGALLGLASAASIKTAVLIASLAGAAAFAWALSPWLRQRAPLRAQAGYAAFFAGGLVLAPAVFVAFYAALGSLDALRYCVLTHNSLAGLGVWDFGLPRLSRFAAVLAASAGLAALLLRRSGDPRLGVRRAVVFLAAAGGQAFLGELCPIWEPEHGLPYYPVGVLFATAALAMGVRGAARMVEGLPRRQALLAALAGALALVELGVLVTRLGSPANKADATAAVIADVVALTDRGDPVMDLKGETVFRGRPFYYALEEVTRRKLSRGLIADSIPDRILATHTCVAVLDHPYFPPLGRAFMNEAFVPVGRLRVCGGVLDPELRSQQFDVLLPARYAIVADAGEVAGWLDDEPYAGPRFLAAGPHRFRARDSAPQRLAFIWAQAPERGFSPFDANIVLSSASR